MRGKQTFPSHYVKEHRMGPAVDYRGAALAVGQIVAYFSPGDRCLYTGEVKIVANSQLVIGSPGADAGIVLMSGTWMAAQNGQPAGEWYAGVVVLPDEYRPV